MSVKMKINMLFRTFVTRVKPPPEKEFRFLDNENTENLSRYQDFDSEVNKPEDENKKTLKENVKGNSKVIEELKNIGVDVSRIPVLSRGKIKSPQVLHLLNKNTAKEFASMIANDVMQSNAPVVEVNSGPGFLAEELLKAGVPKIFMYEKFGDFNWYLHPLMKKYGERLVLRNYNLLQLSYIQYSDNKNNENKMQNIFKGIEMKNWNQEPSMQIISVVFNKVFLFEFQNLMMSPYLSNFGRIILYIAAKPSIIKIFEEIPDCILHRPKHIFLRSMFDSKVLGSLPRKSFFPWSQKLKKLRPTPYFCSDDNEKIFVIRLEAKKDFLSDDFTKCDALMWLCFLKLHMRRRDARIIPELEKLMPGCGRQLIRHNLNIYSRFTELSSYELLILFKIIKSWTQFERSSFVEDLKYYLDKET